MTSQIVEVLDTIWRDIRQFPVLLRRSPTFAAVAIVTLTLGIGANASVASVLDKLVAQDPPGVDGAANVRRIHQRFTVAQTHEVRVRDVFSYPEVQAAMQALPRGCLAAGYNVRRQTIGGPFGFRDVSVTAVVGDYFAALGARPVLGRAFVAGEFGREDMTRLAVISHRSWITYFGGKASVLGQRLELGSTAFTIIGVAPRTFQGVALDAADVWIPFNALADPIEQGPRYAKPYDLRLKLLIRGPRKTVPSTTKRLEAALRVLNVVHDSSASVLSVPLSDALDPQRGPRTLNVLRDLEGAALSILLVACANVTNLLVVRASQRRRELAIRLALGATRSRLAAQLATESILLAAVATVCASVVSIWSARALFNILLPDIKWESSVLTGHVIGAVAVFALVSAAIVGLLPLAFLDGIVLSDALRAAGPEPLPRGARLRNGMLVVQTALSLVLLNSAALFIRSFQRLETTRIGYQPDNIVTASLSGHPTDHDQPTTEYVEELRRRISRLQGVVGVAASATMPIRGIANTRLFLPDRDSVPSVGYSTTGVTSASPEFLNVVGLKVLRGRALAQSDRADAEPVVLVSDLFARMFWPHQEPLGQCIILESRDNPCRRVVGIVENAHAMKIIERPTLQFYVPIAQAPAFLASPRVLLVRAARGQTRSVAATVRRLLTNEQGGTNRWDVAEFSRLLDGELQPWRSSASLFSILGVLGLIIASVGLYGLVAYVTNQRTREIGVRRALGASGSHVVLLVGMHGLALIASGIAAGGVLVVLFGSALRRVLYEVSPYDPVALLTAAAVLCVAGSIACIVPAVRAIGVDPTIALASE